MSNFWVPYFFLIIMMAYFFQRLGFAKLAGHWEDSRGQFSLADGTVFVPRSQMPNFNNEIPCPAETRGLDCYRHNSTRATALKNRVFRFTDPSFCYYGPYEFLNAFKNATIQFYGDSIMQQVYQNLVCQLFVAASAKFTLDWAGKTPDCDTPGCEMHLVSGNVLFPLTNTHLQFRLLNWGLYQHHLRSVPANFNRVFIFCFGMHYNEYAGKPIRDHDSNDFRQHMGELKSDLLLYHKTSRAYILESPPQHFSGTNENGYWSGTAEYCASINETILRKQDWRNKIINETDFTNSSIEVVRIAEVLYSQWDAHATDEDCTHWCKFGGALEFMLSSLVNAMMTKL